MGLRCGRAGSSVFESGIPIAGSERGFGTSFGAGGLRKPYGGAGENVGDEQVCHCGAFPGRGIGYGAGLPFHSRVAGFVAIGAAIPKRGGSFVSVLPFPLRAIMPIILKTAGTKPPESAIRNGLCSDLPEELASRIARSLFRNPAESIRIAFKRLFPMCQSFM